MEAVVLVGGLGKRLIHVVKDIPKPMACVNGKPFLEYVLKYLAAQGIDRVILAVGYKKENIMDYFKNEYAGMEIVYSIEDTPLGTGGGIKKALEYANESEVFVLNGDTFFNVNLNAMKDFHLSKDADITIASKLMHDFDRYGTLDIREDDRKLLSFIEKRPREVGYINGGVYIIKRTTLDLVGKEIFSIEKDFMEEKSLNLKIYAYISDGYFIDIGIPEDYFKAQKDFEEGNISR